MYTNLTHIASYRPLPPKAKTPRRYQSVRVSASIGML